MRDFFLNVTRYPRYLIAFGLGVANSVLEPLAQRRSNPVTAVALIGALVSGLVSLPDSACHGDSRGHRIAMAQGRRVERVAALIRREVSELLVTGIKDERVSLGMVSITNVDVAGDLQHCKIFVSVYGSAEVQQQALEGLRSASNYVKGELGRRLNMRRTPEVIFQLDRGIEKGTSVLGLLNQLEEQRQERGEVPEGTGQQEDGGF